MSIDMTLQKWVIFYNWGLLGNFSFFVRSNWIYFPGYMKNVDTHYENFSSKKNKYRQKAFDNLIWNEQYNFFKLELGEIVPTYIMLVGCLLMWHAFEFDLHLQVHRRMIQFKVKGVWYTSKNFVRCWLVLRQFPWQLGKDRKS